MDFTSNGIEMRTIRVNGEPREVPVLSQPWPIGTTVFLEGRWWPIAAHPCEIHDVQLLPSDRGPYLSFEMPSPRPGDFGEPVPIIYGDVKDTD